MDDPAAPEIAENVKPIAQEAIDRWLAIDPNQHIAVNITRSSFDHLYFAIQDIIASQINFQVALSQWSNGDQAEANRMYDLAKANNVKAVDHMFRLMEHVMLNAEPLTDGRPL